MAKTWKLSEEDTQLFEVASQAPLRERKSAYERYRRGEISQQDLWPELAAAEERGVQQLRDVLGEARLDEYQSMRGHFVEAGLEHQPFKPVVIGFAPVSDLDGTGVGEKQRGGSEEDGTLIHADQAGVAAGGREEPAAL